MGRSRVTLAGTCTTTTSRARAPFSVAKGPPRPRDCPPCAPAAQNMASHYVKVGGLLVPSEGQAQCGPRPGRQHPIRYQPIPRHSWVRAA